MTAEDGRGNALALAVGDLQGTRRRPRRKSLTGPVAPPRRDLLAAPASPRNLVQREREGMSPQPPLGQDFVAPAYQIVEKRHVGLAHAVGRVRIAGDVFQPLEIVFHHGFERRLEIVCAGNNLTEPFTIFGQGPAVAIDEGKPAKSTFDVMHARGLVDRGGEIDVMGAKLGREPGPEDGGAHTGPART